MSTEERLARLERSQRRLRCANIVLVGTVLALAVPCFAGRSDNLVSIAAASSAESVPEVIRRGALRWSVLAIRRQCG